MNRGCNSRNHTDRTTRREFLSRSLVIGAGAAGWTTISPELFGASQQTKSGSNNITTAAIEIDAQSGGFVPLGGISTQAASPTQTSAPVPNTNRGVVVAARRDSTITANTPQEVQIAFTCSLFNSPYLLGWLWQSVSQPPGSQPLQRKNGAVVFFDSTFHAQVRQEWTGGSVAQVDFPVLDAAAPQPFQMKVIIRAVSLIEKTGAAAQSTVPSPERSNQGSPFLTDFFRLQSAAIPMAVSSRVHSIGAFSLVPSSLAGAFSFTLPLTNAAQFSQALNSQGGKLDPARPTDIEVSLVNRQNTHYVRVGFHNCLVSAMNMPPIAPGAVPLVTVQIHFSGTTVQSA